VAEQPTADALFCRHQRDVYRYLLRMTGSPDAAADMLQEVFLRVVRALQGGGAIRHERGWVFSIAHHLLTDDRRRRERDGGVEAPAHGAAGMASNSVEPVQPGTQALAVALSQSLQSLHETDRDVFLLKEVAGLSYEEIAAALGCSIESVRSRLYRARLALREMLSIRF
jgi:RNA polymerase sigma-70 factor (ECF subfamily)